MPKTHRDIVIEETLATVEEAMAEVISYWGCLPETMKEAIEQFRVQLDAAIDSVDLVKRALEREAHDDPGQGPP